MTETPAVTETPEVPAALTLGAAIRRLPVVSILAGDDIAEIRDIIYDAEAGAVVGFTLNKRGILSGRRREVLSTENVHAIGRDAVMVADEGRLQDPKDAHEAIASPDAERNVIGNDVLTESGTSLGSVTDVAVLATPGPGGRAGTVVGYEVKLASDEIRYIPLPAQLAVSGAALVVPDATAQFVVDDLSALAVAVERFRNEIRGRLPVAEGADAVPPNAGEARRTGQSDE